MNGDLNFMVSTEGLSDKGKAIGAESKVIKEALADIDCFIFSFYNLNSEEVDLIVG